MDKQTAEVIETLNKIMEYELSVCEIYSLCSHDYWKR